jgi:hypothetical protein
MDYELGEANIISDYYTGPHPLLTTTRAQKLHLESFKKLNNVVIFCPWAKMSDLDLHYQRALNKYGKDDEDEEFYRFFAKQSKKFNDDTQIFEPRMNKFKMKDGCVLGDKSNISNTSPFYLFHPPAQECYLFRIQIFHTQFFGRSVSKMEIQNNFVYIFLYFKIVISC